MKRVRVEIFGDVTGVSFRAFIGLNANKLKIKGFVRNTKYGEVEAVFEGEKTSINRLLDLCKKGPRLAKVDRLTIREEAYCGEFSEFEIY